jgi:hypothetical protein
LQAIRQHSVFYNEPADEAILIMKDDGSAEEMSHELEHE